MRTLIQKIKKILSKTPVIKIYSHFIFKKIKKKKILDFRNDIVNFKKSEEETVKRFSASYEIYPLLDDKTNITDFEPHYTYHPAWAAKILARTKPSKHIDISSILHFSTIISAFIPVDFYDYRPAGVNLRNLTTAYADLTALPFENNSVESLSCMHTIEHIGLGRYGDKIDYDGDLKAMNELQRVLSVNGTLLIVTPIGKPKIAFNAHRIYSYNQIITYFSQLKLIEFSLIPDEFKEIGIIYNASADIANVQNWGCGCFWFKKELKT